MNSLFGKTRCGEILTEKFGSMSKKDRHGMVRTFEKYKEVFSELNNIQNTKSKNKIISALKKEVRHTIYNDYKMKHDEFHDDVRQRLLYCINFELNKYLR